MKRSALALSLLLPLALVWSACKKPAAAGAGASPAKTAAVSNPEVGDDPMVPRIPIGIRTHCAVTGEEFTVRQSTVQVTYKGKRYVFCCPDCQPQFAKNPAKFAVN